MKAEIWKPFQSANIGKKTLSVDPNMHGWWEWIPRKSRNHESSEIWSHCPGAFSVGKVSFYIHRCPNWTYTCVWMDILYTEPCSSSGSSSNGEYPFSTVARSLLSKHMDSLQLQKKHSNRITKYSWSRLWCMALLTWVWFLSSWLCFSPLHTHVSQN